MDDADESARNRVFRPEFPSLDDWASCVRLAPAPSVRISTEGLSLGRETPDRFLDFTRRDQMNAWASHLGNRIGDAYISAVMLTFYFQRGIPDEPWSAPSPSGGIQYFPRFSEEHFDRRFQFTYYADAFYFKLFTAIDTIGQLLNVSYDLAVSRVTFAKALRALGPIDQRLHKCLEEIRTRPWYGEARSIRDDITHNMPPQEAHRPLELRGNSILLGGRSAYIPCARIMANVRSSFSGVDALVLACGFGMNITS